MAQMPIVAGLVGGAAAAASGRLTEVLDMLLPEEVEQLQQLASAPAGEGTEPVDVVPPEGEGDEAGGGTSIEDVDTSGPNPVPETAADEGEEAPAEEEELEEQVHTAGSEDFAAIKAQVDASVAEAQGYREEFDRAAEEALAAEEDGGEPDKVAKLVEQADKVMAKIEELQQDAQDAIDDEDAEKAAQAGLEVGKACLMLQGLLMQAQSHSTPTKAPDEAVTEAEPIPSLALWANKYKSAVQ